MRHPHPLMYLLAFGTPIFIGLVAGVKTWTEADATTSLISLAAQSIALAIAPVLIVLAGLMAFGGVMLYLGTYRVGNLVRITGGDHSRSGLDQSGLDIVRGIDCTVSVGRPGATGVFPAWN